MPQKISKNKYEITFIPKGCKFQATEDWLAENEVEAKKLVRATQGDVKIIKVIKLQEVA